MSINRSDEQSKYTHTTFYFAKKAQWKRDNRKSRVE